MSVSALNVDSGSVVICKETNKTTDVAKNDASVSQLFQKTKKMTFELHFAFLLRSEIIVIVKFSKIRILENQHYWAAVATETLTSPADSDWMEVTQMGASRGRMC